MFILEVLLNLGLLLTQVVILFLGVIFFVGVAKGTIDSMISASKDTVILTFVIGTTFITTVVFSYIKVLQFLGYIVTEEVSTITISEGFINPSNVNILQKIENLKENFGAELEKLKLENNILIGDIEKLKEALIDCNKNIIISNNENFFSSMHAYMLENNVYSNLGIAFATIIVCGLGYCYLSSSYQRLPNLIESRFSSPILSTDATKIASGDTVEKVVIDILEKKSHIELASHNVSDILLERIADDILLEFLIENQEIIRDVVVLTIQQS